ncbi:MAG TPA: YdcF family protein [Anaerolineaceae bacterium]|nr:YdcF family protein [Anaerolineaceae bacterium]HPN51656.1 YdcF family protein [Anaerolineaceae bacterium]
MFLFLSKFLPIFVYPAGFTVLLLLLAILLRNKKHAALGVTIFALSVLFLAGNRYISYMLAQTLEWQYLPPAEFSGADVAVVLGGATEADFYPRSGVEVNAAGDRVLYAGVLYQQGKVKNILLSGGNVDWMDSEKSTPAREMKIILELMSVPEEVMWLQNRSVNTHEDAVFSAEMLREKGITKIYLITSAMHMPRSVALFRKQGLDVIPVPVDYTVTQTGMDTLLNGSWESKLINIFPTASGLSLTTNVMKEYIGYFIYSLQGWL